MRFVNYNKDRNKLEIMNIPQDTDTMTITTYSDIVNANTSRLNTRDFTEHPWI